MTPETANLIKELTQEATRLRALNGELLKALEAVARIGDRKTAEWDAARAAIAKARGEP